MQDKPKNVRCPICRKYKYPTEDHIPPRSCGNSQNTKYHFFLTDYIGSQNRTEFISQGGLKRRFLCSDCNNRLLGAGPDKELGSLCQTAAKAISEKESSLTWEGDIKQIIVAALGHILGAMHYDKSLPAKEMRAFIHKGIVPEQSKLFLFLYPFHEIFVVRDCVAAPLKPNKQSILTEPIGLSGMYFYPLAFIYTEKENLGNGLDLFEIYQEGETKITLNIDSWSNPITKTVLPADWPFHLDNINDNLDSGCMTMAGAAGGESISTIPQSKGVLIKIHHKNGTLTNPATNELLRFK